MHGRCANPCAICGCDDRRPCYPEEVTLADKIALLGRRPDAALALVTNDLKDRIVRMRAEITVRRTTGLVVEGQGGLRPEPVCLTAPRVVFDRVETALELRVIDVFDETGNLGAECTILAFACCGG